MGSATTFTSNRSSKVINYINYNQTGTCISVGTSTGYEIFNCDPFGRFYAENEIENGGFSIVEMLFSSSLVALVGNGDSPSLSPRKLRLVNTKRRSVICEITFPTAIMSVKMNRARLIVLLSLQIYIYDINTMRLLYVIDKEATSHNLIGLSPSTKNNYLAYPSPSRTISSDIKPNLTTNNLNLSATLDPNLSIVSNKSSASADGRSASNGSNWSVSTTGSSDSDGVANTSNTNYNETGRTFRSTGNGNYGSNNNNNNNNTGVSTTAAKSGEVVLLNLETLQPTMVIEAHKNGIAALALSQDGLLLATASEKGTIIRIFSVESGVKLYQFRRGTYTSKIYSMCFSDDNQFLSVCSSSRTVHIFKLGDSNLKSNTNIDGDVDVDGGNDNGNNSSDSDDDNDNDNDNDGADMEVDASTGAISEELRGNGGHADDNRSIETRNSGSNTSSGGINEYPRPRKPYVDASRKTVGRMIRNSSQSVARKAAKTLGQIFPIKVTSILEPTRHFASLKIPIDDMDKYVRSVAYIGPEVELNTAEYPELVQTEGDESANERNGNLNGGNGVPTMIRMLTVKVVTSEGFFYNYVLDPLRGGDCMLLSQYSLLAD